MGNGFNVNWFVTIALSIVISLTMSVFGGYITPKFTAWLSSKSDAKAQKQAEKMQAYNDEVKYYQRNPYIFNVFISTTIIKILILFSMATIVSVFGTLFMSLGKMISFKPYILYELFFNITMIASALLYVFSIQFSYKSLLMISDVNKLLKNRL